MDVVYIYITAEDMAIATICDFYKINMFCLTVNMCYVVVQNIQVLLLITRNFIILPKPCDQQSTFMCKPFFF